MEEIFVGQQPILDVKGDLFSYELLYRNSDRNAFPDVNPEIATIAVIVNTYLSPGFEQIAVKKTFINFSATLLETDIFDTLDPDRVVIEILEDVTLISFCKGNTTYIRIFFNQLITSKWIFYPLPSHSGPR